MEGRCVMVTGDVHREWDAFARQLRSSGITRQEFIQIGDFGVGFGSRAAEEAALLALDTVPQPKEQGSRTRTGTWCVAPPSGVVLSTHPAQHHGREGYLDALQPI